MSLWTALGIAILTVAVAYYLAGRVTRPKRVKTVGNAEEGFKETRLGGTPDYTPRSMDEEYSESLDIEGPKEHCETPLPHNVADFAEYQDRKTSFDEMEDVKISPPKPAVGREITIRYKGKLSDSFMLIMRVGYGFSEWENITEIPMAQEDGIWKATIKVTGLGRLNACFHDQDGNWDNNDKGNWSWDISL